MTSGASTRYAASGCALPFSESSPSGSKTNACCVSANVEGPTRICPGPAAFCRRDAAFTVSPVTAYAFALSDPMWPATTGPVLMPMCTASGWPTRDIQRSLSVAMCSRISSAARTARSGSSSCATGAPKTAITASPMYFSTKPSKRRIVVDIIS